MYGYHMPLGGLMGLLILVVIGIVFFRVLKGESGVRDAQEVLDERYAKGEIDEEKYLRMKENLKR